MKMRKKLVLGVVVVMAVAALTIAPAPAFAGAEGPCVPHAPMANMGGNAPDDVSAVANACDVSGIVPEADDAIGAEDADADAPSAASEQSVGESSSGEGAQGTDASKAAASAEGGQPLPTMMAGESKAVAQDDAKKANNLDAYGDSPEAAKDNQLTVQSGDALGGSMGPLEIAIAKNLAMGVAYGAGSGIASWAAPDLLNTVFGNVLEDGTDKKLDEILTKLDEIQQSIDALNDKMTTQQLQDVFNKLRYTLNDTTTSIIYESLQEYDDALASDLADAKTDEDKQKAYDKAKSNRLDALTSALGITDYRQINSKFDDYIDDLWTDMTVPYDVTIGNQPEKLTLMQIHYELLRRTYKWENQAYDEWASFQGRCVSLLLSSLALENASLQARIDLLGEEEVPAPLAKKKQETIERIKLAAGYKVITADGPVTIYPGYFSEEAWASQYWMYKERPDYRYYWVPGHEILFFAQVNTQDVPKEEKGLGLRDPDDLKGITVEWSNGVSLNSRYDVTINYDFWKPFLRYQGGDYPLASVDQLKMIYKDYGSDTHLYDIFIGEKEGNFLGLEEGDIVHWWFVVDQDKGHHIAYHKHWFKGDNLQCYVVASKNAKTDKADLCIYHYNSHKADTNRHYIGIGVARVGPETYTPDKVGLVLEPQSEVYTAVDDDSAVWQPSNGDLALGYGNAYLGAVERVYMDGEELDASCYEVQDGKIVLAQGYLASLGYDEHELFLDTEGGGHIFLFATRADSVDRADSDGGSMQRTAATPASAMPKTGDAFALLATMFMIAAMLSACVVACARGRMRRYAADAPEQVRS